jgi:hypothetical protein
MKKFLTSVFIITLALVSCKNEAENQTPKVVVPFYQVANQQQNQTLATPQPNQSQSLYQTTSAQNTTTQVQTNAPVAVAKGMNPSHGQPGHRCDIPVGSPLNSPPATNSSAPSQVISNSTVTVPSATMTATKTPKGMNPAHGQPGHRCDIPVGSPLNSPISTNKPTSQQVVSSQSTTVSPTTATTTPTPEGMNPPHGQDKHRCDIAVGAPLPAE